MLKLSPIPSIVSAGVLLNAQGKVLLINASDTGDCWGIPKGQVNPGESIRDAAVRELREETNIDIYGGTTGPHIILSPHVAYRYAMRSTFPGTKKSCSKHVYVYYAVSSLFAEDHNLRCNSFLPNGKPEAADFGWFPLEECYDRVVKSQKELFQYVADVKHVNEYYRSLPKDTK
jgi:8-oxo-dGTP pyrophosphatase MutT (NUDIX family)